MTIIVLQTLFPFFFAVLLVTGMHLTWPLKYKGRGNK